jgi:hypothetical protein
MGWGKISANFIRWSGSTFPSPQSPELAAAIIGESIMTETWFREMVRNLPYMGFISITLTYGIGKFVEKCKSRLRK